MSSSRSTSQHGEKDGDGGGIWCVLRDSGVKRVVW